MGGDVLAVGVASLDHAGVRWTVRRGDQEIAELRSFAATPPYAPLPLLERVTDRRLPAAVLYPDNHVTGRRLPVLLDIYGGPGHQEVVAARAAWLERQWWADAGFAVVTIDNRGTPGVAPSFEGDPPAGGRRDPRRPDRRVDRSRRQAPGPGPGSGRCTRLVVRGWLAGLAVLRHPELFRCGIAGAPVTDWALYDTAYTERYLGLPEDGMDVYAHHSLVEMAAEPVTGPDQARPLLLVHGMADDNVVAAHAPPLRGPAEHRPAACRAAVDRDHAHGRERHRRTAASAGTGFPPYPSAVSGIR
ncbi:prolyl oligopeptidase family serine peptidase [Micromonospora sp. M12]